jgi:hypothetical protein
LIPTLRVMPEAIWTGASQIQGRFVRSADPADARSRLPVMPGWPRLVLVAAGMGLAAVNGIETSEGGFDLVGGILIAAALFWPGASFECQSRRHVYPLGRRWVGWPPPGHVRRCLEGYGGTSDGLVYRFWSFPFPTSWVSVRRYPQIASAQSDRGAGEEYVW